MRGIIEDKRGGYADVFVFVVMSFLITVFFGMMYYGFTQMNTVLTSVHFTLGSGATATNFSTIVNQTWGEVYSSYSQLKTLSYVLIFGMILTILVSSFIVRSPPIFLILYIIVSIGGIIVGAYISNAYQLLLSNADFGSTLQSFAGASYMILYLPYLAGIVALFSGMLSLIGLNRTSRETSSGVAT